MSFYADPAFFLLLVPIVGVAFALGYAERPLKGYGLAVSVAMLLLLFGRNLAGLGYLCFFLVLSLVLCRLTLGWFNRGAEEDHAAPDPASGPAPSGSAPAPAASPAAAPAPAAPAGPDPHAVAKYRVALACQIAPLFIYKSCVVFGADLLGFLGISYMTFKAVQVLIEIRDRLITEFKPLDYLAFMVFFPTFTSGPILRSRSFAKDVARPLARDEYLERFYKGCGWFGLGALYKFVGAPLASWFMWFVPSAVGTATLGASFAGQLVYGLGYGLYLFFDFAGYSAMAMGLGLTLGVDVPRNFRAPFCSVDIKDFWNRWHITLSFWLRDYVFMRFSSFALRRKLLPSRLATACAGYLVNMTLMGLWHGFTLDYVAYGVYHGLLLAGCELAQKKWGFYKRHKDDAWFKAASWAVTMVAVFFGFALFSGQIGSLLRG